MTDAPGTPDKPTPAEDEPRRADALIDAVVGGSSDDGRDTPPTPAEPASAGVASDDDTKGKSATENDAKKNKKSKKPEPTTRWGKLWHGWIKPIGTVFIIVALLRSTIIDWNDVPSGSMEPTILVGDRILVNKMAYALQVPLSGPKIGVPFTPLQWDNPLDGLPAWHWGTPRRGDIVTFWNPVTGVRMVKRIVAEPGDTLELRGGVMTITPRGGTPTTATYVDTTPTIPNTTVVGQNAMGGDKTEATRDQEESLLGEVRSIQQIPVRWIEDWAMYRFADGRELIALDGRVNVNGQREVPVEAVLEEFGEPAARFAVLDGVPYVNGEEVGYNQFAEAYLAPLASANPVTFGEHTIGAEGGGWLIDGEPASSEQVQMLLIEAGYIATRRGQTPKTPNIEQRGVLVRYNHLRSLMTSSFGPVTLGDDEYYMIGDNRNNSTDSRYFGPVQRSEITGEAVAIPVSFHGKMRELRPNWSRWFHGLD